jgi:hypothetical protein
VKMLADLLVLAIALAIFATVMLLVNRWRT